MAQWSRFHLPIDTGDAGDVGWSLDQKDPWEEEMAPHSSILIWKTHGQRSLVGIQSMGVTKSWTRLSNWAHTHTHTIMVCRVHHGYVLQTSHLMPITSLRWWKRITFPSWPSNRLREDVTCLASHHWKAWTQNQFFLLGVPCFLLYLTHDASLILKTYVFLLNFHFIMVMMMIVALY